VFCTFVILEVLISRKKHLNLYDKEDTVVNMVLGFVTFLTKVGIKGSVYLLYFKIYEYVPFKLSDDSVWVFVLGLFVNDFMFYWYHRISHTTRFFWALHVAHHSSEKMNITTAMRGNFLNNVFHTLFWIPMLFLGFSPWVVITSDAFSYFYQLWLHTRIIPKLGPFEWFFNTPSHHRVHHGSNPQYIDRNYAAVFIIWDKLFGTFTEEGEEVTYGITKPVNKRNPISVAFAEFGSIFSALGRRKGLSGKLHELFRKPY
jgi:sterol desaturase/sphingolipid hydroxylase (fatty acid hydroxylase superfamily)